MKRYLPLLIIAGLLALVIGVSQYAESTQQYCEESAGQAKAASVAKRNDADKACKPKEWARYFTWPEGIGAWAVILTLFVIAWQSIETAKAAESARSGAISAKNAADSAMAGQRAYVATTCYWTVDKFRQANARFGVNLQNVGHLPTAKMRNFIDYRVVEGELPENFVFPENAEPVASGTLLVPGDKVQGPHIPRESWISNTDLLAVESGTKNVYFFGWVKYFDGFPDTPERITRFCYSIRVTGNNEPPFVFQPYKHHNSAE